MIEICLTSLGSEGIRGLLHQFHLPLVFFISGSGFVAYWLYLKKALRQLDPSSVIPEHVKAAFESLSEGVVVTDGQERIVLANEAFIKISGHYGRIKALSDVFCPFAITTPISI